MKYDKKIKSLIRNIRYECDNYLETVEYMNECASTDRLLESIIQRLKEVEMYHSKRFKYNRENDR